MVARAKEVEGVTKRWLSLPRSTGDVTRTKRAWTRADQYTRGARLLRAVIVVGTCSVDQVAKCNQANRVFLPAKFHDEIPDMVPTITKSNKSVSAHPPSELSK